MKIYPLLVGLFKAHEGSSFKGGNPDKKVWYASYIFYVEHPDGSFIVDTGFADPEFCRTEFNHICKRETKMMSVEERLKKFNLKPSDIDTVILTHCHWDHIGGLDLFTNAQVYCQREEISWSIAPPAWQNSSYPKALSNRLASARERLKVLDGEVVLKKGITLRKVGGHSPGGQMIFIKSENKEVIITGDAVLLYANLEKHTPIGTYHNLEESIKVLDYINNKTMEGEVIVLPSHDIQVWEKYKDGLPV